MNIPVDLHKHSQRISEHLRPIIISPQLKFIVYLAKTQLNSSPEMIQYKWNYTNNCLVYGFDLIYLLLVDLKCYFSILASFVLVIDACDYHIHIFDYNRFVNFLAFLVRLFYLWGQVAPLFLIGRFVPTCWMSLEPFKI